MRTWLVVLAACSGSTPEPRPVLLPPRPIPVVAAPPPAPPPAPKLRAAQVGPHGHTISLLAISDDGTAAVSADGNRLLRVWPTLDGTREPVVLTGPIPVAIAIAHDGDGFAIAIQDAGGTLHVERLARDGAQYPEIAIESPLPYEQLEATRTGFVALRADDTVDVIAPTGAHHAIAPPPARIARLVVRGDAVLALGQGRGRLLAGDKWGEQTPALPFDVAHAALAPDGRHVAGVGPRGVVEIDLASGRSSAIAETTETVLGYSDATTLVTATNVGMLVWHGPHPAMSDLSSVVALGELTTVVGDGRVIAGAGLQLVLPAPDKVQYLGYDIVDPVPLHSTALGLVVRNDAPQLVDEHLEARPLFAKRHDADWMDFAMLDERHGVALVRDFSEDMEKRWCEVIDLATGKRVQKLVADARLDTLQWEPSTKLFATLSLLGAQLFHYENGKLVAAGSLPGSPDRVFLLDPALANGDIAIVVESGRLAKLDAQYKVHDAQPVHGTLLAIDRGGRMISRRGADLVVGDTVVHDAGRENIRISPDLKRVVAFDGKHVTLVDRDGSTRWTAVLWGIRDLGWTPDNELVASAGGLVRLDLATGKPIARRCGWTFGLTTTMHVGGAVGVSACDD